MVPAAKPTRRRVARRSPAAFTLLEVLITIGIIAILVTAGVLGFRAIEESSAKKQTRTALANAEALVKGMRGVGSHTRIEGPAQASPRPFYEINAVTKQADAVQAPDSITTESDDSVQARNALVRKDGAGLKLANGDTRNLNCQRLMTTLLSVPANKTAVQALSKEHLLESPDPKSPYDPPVLADAWGNPLILVPSGGLTGVDLPDGGNNLTITSTGSISTTANPVPSNRMFWASAGPDGSFKSGADNLYSFEQ